MILMIDDSEHIHELIAFMLSRAGFPVLPAKSGEEGIAQFYAHRVEIDMVLLDLQMPGMGGVATFHQLHNIAPTLPIIIFSALDSAEVRQLFPGQQALTILNKNCNTAELLTTLGSFILNVHNARQAHC